MAKWHSKQILKGLAIGSAVGAAAGLIGGAAQQPRYQKSAKNTVNKAIKTFSNFVDALS
ncbi:MAG: hypothetical protein LBR73_08955 [Oscillospiraceae bacterium]|jgi:gas vesicle protein|nr:hypothetical protein [Oscillospiraceae bacterium]